MVNLIKNYSVELGKGDLEAIIKRAVQAETCRHVLSIDFHINAGSEDRFQYTPASLGKVVVKLGEVLNARSMISPQPV